MQHEPTKSYQSLHEWWVEAGIDVAPIAASPKPTAKKPNNKPAQQTKTAASASKPAMDRLKSATEAASNVNNLEQLYAAIRNFDAGVLSQAATQAVIARGNPKAKVMLIGEAPGREEDVAGKPFVGAAGQFLDKMFASVALDESNLYISNSVFWRPKANRKPTDEEMQMCLPFIHRHIALIAPKIIVTIGGSSSKTLLGVEDGITKLRGKWEQYTIKNPDGSDSETTIPILPMYHPAFVLRKPALKAQCWNDLLSLQDKLAELGEVFTYPKEPQSG